MKVDIAKAMISLLYPSRKISLLIKIKSKIIEKCKNKFQVMAKYAKQHKFKKNRTQTNKL